MRLRDNRERRYTFHPLPLYKRTLTDALCMEAGDRQTSMGKTREDKDTYEHLA